MKSKDTVERKIVHYLVFDISIELRDSVPEDYSSGAVAGVDNTPDENGVYRIWFKILPTEYTIVHETWHLFFAIMASVDEQDHTMKELRSEVYAYNFQHLYSLVLETLTRMKLYRKAWNLKYKWKTKESN